MTVLLAMWLVGSVVAVMADLAADDVLGEEKPWYIYALVFLGSWFFVGIFLGNVLAELERRRP